MACKPLFSNYWVLTFTLRERLHVHFSSLFFPVTRKYVNTHPQHTHMLGPAEFAVLHWSLQWPVLKSAAEHDSPFLCAFVNWLCRVKGTGLLSSGNEQAVLADSSTAPNSLFRGIAAMQTGAELVPQWRWGGWAHGHWRLLSCIASKVRIYTHPFTADQLLCRAYQKEKQEADS